jgi:hypothetical protein
MSDNYMLEHGSKSEFRDELVGQLAHPQTVGNLQEEAMEAAITRLAAVQSCIIATREAISDARKRSR